MHYVSVEGLAKSYGIQPLFSNLSFNIEEGDKIALVARNGSGKTTLMRILAGKETADEGKVWINKDVDVVLFEQDPVFDEKKSILENIFYHNHPVINAIRDYELAAEKNDPEKMSTAISRIDELNAWDFDVKVKQVLGKLNIHNLDQVVGTLSGGQKKRVALAKTLIDIGFEHKHVLLIMDEPTNHLDLSMVEWLEYYLDKENVTLLLVTHDRYFLDTVCDEIWEMNDATIHVYKGDYANYLEKKAARIESETASIDKARNTYRKELEWMRKQPKARTTKSKSRQDNFYEVEKRAKQKIVDEQMQLQVKMSRLGGKIAEMKKVYKQFGDKIILKGFDFTFKKGEKIGIIGKNGTGKSTFVNMLQGLEQPDSGKINIGDTVIFGNYSQKGLQVKEDMRVIEYVKNMAEHFPLASGGSLSASQFLELFLFSPEKQYTYISKLSGGEKRRLHILSILFRNPNFLVLDEPTNDLDLPTLGVLENFLSDFPGCVIIISHDRYFMDRLVDHLFVFEGEGVIRDYPGNYSQYRESRELEVKSEEVKSEKGKVKGEEEIGEKGKVKGVGIDTSEKLKDKSLGAAPATVTGPKRQFSFKEKREFEILGKEIADLTEEKKRITEKLSNGDTPFEELQQISVRIIEVERSLDEKELRWLELSDLAE